MFKNFIRQLAKWLVLPLLLFFAAIVLSAIYFFNSDIYPNVLSVNHSHVNFKIEKGVIKGRFIAKENYLGIMTLRFNGKKVLSNEVVFRLRNKSDLNWYYVATISASLYHLTPQYAFGVPVIVQSKNQTYIFEAREKKEVTDQSVNFVINNKEALLISQYMYPINLLLENKALLLDFTIKKMAYYIFEENSWKVIAIYSIPLVYYLLYVLVLHKILPAQFIQKVRQKLSPIISPYMFFVFICVGIDFFIVRKYPDGVTTQLIFLWVLGVAAYDLDSRYSLGVALVFLTLCTLLLFADMYWMAEKSAIWAYMFLIVGAIHTIIEFKLDNSPRSRTLFGTINTKTNLAAFSNLVRTVLSILPRTDALLIAFGRKVEQMALSSFQNFIRSLAIFTIVSTIFLTGLNLYLRVMSYYERQMKNPSQPVIEPTLVYPATKVILYGEHFGDNSNSKFALKRDGIKIRTDYWDDRKIIFTIPLDWKKPGDMKIWIEKPVEWHGVTVIERTKPVTIKLLIVTGKFTPIDNLYFEQIKSWRKETRELNE